MTRHIDDGAVLPSGIQVQFDGAEGIALWFIDHRTDDWVPLEFRDLEPLREFLTCPTYAQTAEEEENNEG